MSAVDRRKPSRILTFAAQTVEQVQRIALTPAGWVDVAASVRSMEDALERGDLAGLDRERRLLQGKLPVRQKARAELDTEKVPAPPHLRSAAENLSRKIETAQPAKGDAGKNR